MLKLNIRSHKLVLATVAAGLTTVIAQPASAAATASSNLEVSATVTTNCDVSTTPINFGNVDVTTGSAVNGTGAISVTCTNGTAWTASADVGEGQGADFAARKMSNGNDLLDYSLYTDVNRTALWGDGVEGVSDMFTGVGSGTAQSRTVYGKIAAGQTGLPAGEYNDSVVVTVTY